MFYVDNRLQYPVWVEQPNTYFARALQQAIGGVEGEIRVGPRGDDRNRGRAVRC